MIEVSTSVLSVKKEEAIKTFYNLESGKTDYFHIDVMDGEFVENNTAELMKEYATIIKHISNLPLDVHLMVKDVETFIQDYLELMPSIITFHYESNTDKEVIMNRIKTIKENGVKVGISIKPDTDIEEIKDFFPYIHLVLIMTVEPGKGGQSLIVNTIEKVEKLREYLEKNNLDISIEVDGGINNTNVKELQKAGADIIVAGTYIINSENYEESIKSLKIY